MTPKFGIIIATGRNRARIDSGISDRPAGAAVLSVKNGTPASACSGCSSPFNKKIAERARDASRTALI
eukprot:scaffold141986_cov29-Tisochrysis_lutea.AAC.9